MNKKEPQAKTLEKHSKIQLKAAGRRLYGAETQARQMFNHNRMETMLMNKEAAEAQALRGREYMQAGPAWKEAGLGAKWEELL